MGKIVFVLAALLCAEPRPVQSVGKVPDPGPGRSIPEYRLDLPKSSLRFETTVTIIIGRMKVEGYFEKFDVQAWIDGGHPESTRGSVVVEMASVKSDTAGVSDDAIRKHLEVDKYPKSVLELVGLTEDAARSPYNFTALVNMTFMEQAYRNIPVSINASWPDPDKQDLRISGAYTVRKDGSVIRFSFLLKPVSDAS